MLYAQRPQGSVEAEVVCFARGADSVRLELYYSVQHGALSFTGSGSSWIADVPVIAEVWQDDKRIAFSSATKKRKFEGTKEQLDAKAFDLVLDVFTFDIPAKKNTVAYLIYHGKDQTGTEIFDTLRRLTYVPVVRQDSFVFSGVELAARIEPSDAGVSNPFYKVGYLIFSNPSLVFGGDYSSVNFYTELNVPINLSSTRDSVEMIVRLLDGSQKEVLKRTQFVQLHAPYTPYIGALDIEGLETNSYSLAISAVYNGKVVAAIRKGFFLESGMIISEETSDEESNITDDATLYLMSDFYRYSDLELAEKIEQSAELMPNDVRKSIEKAKGADEKKRGLFEFWRFMDEPGTRPLSAYYHFLTRVDEANKQFTYQKTIGWKTHRGRVFIKYGRPEYVGGEPFATESKPYIIWEYYSKRYQLSSGSRAQFVFVDLYGGGNYQLVHSNVKGEVSQPNWYSAEAFRLR